MRVGLVMVCAILELSAWQPGMAHACEFTFATPDPGVLTGEDKHSGVVPRNVAFMATRSTPKRVDAGDVWLPVRLEDGSTPDASLVTGTLLENGDAIVKLTEPLPANLAIGVYAWSRYGQGYVTNDAIDELAPSRPDAKYARLNFHDGTSACGNDSCGDYASYDLRLSAPSVDDWAASEQLVYAVYLGQSREAALTQEQPDTLFKGSALTYSLSLWNVVDRAWLDRDAFIAIAAIDQAGNVSARSEPIQINSESDGCALARGRAQGSRLPRFGSFFLCLVAALGVARRAFRPRRLRVPCPIERDE